jgi:hypothetical protein
VKRAEATRGFLRPAVLRRDERGGWVVVDLYIVRALELSPPQLILMGTAM